MAGYVEPGTERDMDLILVRVQADVEANYEKWHAWFKGKRMAHVEARPHPMAPQPGTTAAQAALQPPPAPSTLTPKAGGY